MRQSVGVASISTRVIALTVALGSFGLLLTAARLTPSPAGVASHTGLGLARCQMLEQTGVPCPSCGMTTSFTWFARGNVIASTYVQPMGALLAFASACCVWGGVYIAWTGRPIHRLLNVLPARRFLITIFVVGMLGWGWKIMLRFTELDGW